ncbi:hypothetical protein HYS00_03510 [Candidatus Microgenomates bacterium]|nr:hypothetical protein [Candidatus Microgenomates bacterium]
MEKGIVTTLKYFSQFEYAPTLAELHMFHPLVASEPEMSKTLASMVKKGTILCTVEAKNSRRYTLGGYSIFLNKTVKNVRISQNKLKRVRPYLRLLQKSSLFSLVGISGSVAMGNGDESADIDLFIITKAGRMWTARALAGAAAALMGIRRGRLATTAPDKICLNMFMDETDLRVPKHKQTTFIAHEILQMKPVFSKGAIYDHFLTENAWIYELFPNTKATSLARQEHALFASNNAPSLPGLIYSGLESIHRSWQLALINRHKTTEIVTDTQLWFFPDDFERKLKG